MIADNMTVDETTVVVLSGGRARRLGHTKAVVNLDGRSALRVLLDGLPILVPVVVVGDCAPDVERPVRVLREDPPFAGPLHALRTAVLQEVKTRTFIALAVDLPLAASHTLALLPRLGVTTAGTAPQAVIPVDASGRRQPLAGAYDTKAVRDALAALGDTIDRPMAALLDHLVAVEVPINPDDPMAGDYRDIDTPTDLAVTRRRLRRSRPST